MELNTIKDAFDRVTKKQKLPSSKIREAIDQINQEIEKAMNKILSADGPDSTLDHRSVLSELNTSLHNVSPLGQLEGPQKELNIALTKYGKILERSFNPDISKAYRNIDFDIHTLNQIIANHFYHQGLFDFGDSFISDAREPEAAAVMKSSFLEMYQILEAMKSQDLGPALDWATTISDKLTQNGSDLLLKLHSMQYLKIIQSGNKGEALEYARTYLSPFASSHMVDVQKLMGCLLWVGKLERSPYHALLSQSNWDRLAEELKREFCNLLGQSYNSPLNVTVAAGIQCLPPLLKFMNVMVGKKQEWQSMNQLPVPVELDREFQFHSVFVCPVSKEQSTDDNPPMLMSCGHVLCKQSIAKMSKNSTKVFKCPYCPTDIDAAQCRQLFF
ncbi:protein RMD5 homolog isoform X2 [Prosopis cineraria]|nr:protein RMD5 homolog [Prosopis cineraria]XP_054791626.1 protein RMD5 homolog [Prosopis cineraria]XP_054791627.1 protein RMD5 homolog [Prosopis cineraria]XP_054791628.1 protein RMD5 homolog [Prosopis cineraria]XP_054791629.1 protein RMD5 homolog [Prosopis cineraria]XP_054825319.1 protein RMD5 homolog isoform X2 [Prosopis cineraria]XP_054825320.1 protein RMD5 homolog isoform X2 [Prosopis cineraria]XP_054825321.1 protein RMD5 homolog isoform X2 [Prosopis cineraria]XP_054825322.1 protein RMD